QRSHDRNRTLVRYYVLQSRTNVWDLTKVIHNVIQRSTKLSTSYPQHNPKLSTRMITLLTYDNVRQTIINVDLKRYTYDRRTIRRPTVANVRKSYPQANKSYPQVKRSLLLVIHRLVNATQSYPQVIHSRSRTCVRRGGGGGRTSVWVAGRLKDSYKFLKLGSL